MGSIHNQGANLLFFNGDMIMGYGNAYVPADTTSVDAIVKSDLVTTYRQYAFWRGMVAPLMEGGTYVVPCPATTKPNGRPAARSPSMSTRMPGAPIWAI